MPNFPFIGNIVNRETSLKKKKKKKGAMRKPIRPAQKVKHSIRQLVILFNKSMLEKKGPT